ncbi:MAG: C25 family peptidase propeptide domain-containing protein [Bacteroidota bacterium]
MLHRFGYLSIVVVMFTLSSRSEWVSLKRSGSAAAPPRVTLVQDDRNGTVLKVEVSGFEVGDLVAGAQSYNSIDLLTGAFTTEVGFPELPCVTKILAVPDRAAISVEVVDVGEEHSFTGYVVPPARRTWKESDPEPPYVERMDAYQSEEASLSNMHLLILRVCSGTSALHVWLCIRSGT